MVWAKFWVMSHRESQVYLSKKQNIIFWLINLSVFLPKTGVGNFFRPRAVFENFWALWATLLDKPHYNSMNYKEIVLKTNYSAGRIQGFGAPDLARGPDFAHPWPKRSLINKKSFILFFSYDLFQTKIPEIDTTNLESICWDSFNFGFTKAKIWMNCTSLRFTVRFLLRMS